MYACFGREGRGGMGGYTRGRMAFLVDSGALAQRQKTCIPTGLLCLRAYSRAAFVVACTDRRQFPSQRMVVTPYLWQRQKVKGKRQEAKGKRQKAKGKRQKAKGKRQKAKGKRQRQGNGGLACRWKRSRPSGGERGAGSARANEAQVGRGARGGGNGSYPCPLEAMPSPRYCSVLGVEMA